MKLFILAMAVTFLLSALCGPFMIKKLKQLKYGQKILEVGPKWHMSKEHTPTMGGFIFIIPVTLTVVGIGISNLLRGSFEYIVVLFLALGFGAIGFIDDYTKVKKKQNMGLTALQKIILQLVMAVVFISVIRYMGIIDSSIFVPFLGESFGIPWGWFVVFAVFVIVGTVNSVNLTDGIDGLAASVSLPVVIFFGICAIFLDNLPAALFAFSLAGGLGGFLIYNINPAKVFMGDTGSLFLGGAVAGLAFSVNLPLVLAMVGIMYIIEALSDIIQVTYFKISGGKRVFKMAPIHHHFEMCGWGEKKIVFVFTIVTFIMCLISIYGVINIFAPE